MKENMMINKISMLILHIGLSVCCVVGMASFFYLKELQKCNILNISEAKSMLEHIIMAVLLIVTLALAYDIHLKTEKRV